MARKNKLETEKEAACTVWVCCTICMFGLPTCFCLFQKVLCTPLCLSMHCIKQISHSHRSAAIVVWRALRRRRLHDDVGHVNGEISGLLGRLKAREENITGSTLLTGPLLIHTSLFVSLHYTHDPVCTCVCTLPFSGRTIDWEWQSCCLASYSELQDWPSVLLSVIVLRVSEEVARCMLFTGVKGFVSVAKWWQTSGRESPDLLSED